MTIVACTVGLAALPADAERLWCEVDSWGSFVEGFGSVVGHEGNWPWPGSAVVWDSTPHGRGRVRERIISRQPGVALVSELQEQRLTGLRKVRFCDCEPQPGRAGVRVEVQLDYRLRGRRWQSLLLDWLFVKRALRESMGRELEGFSRALLRI